MRAEQSIYALIYVFLLLLFGMECFLFCLLPFSPTMQLSLSQFFAAPPWYVSTLAYAVTGMFVLLLVFSWMMHKKRYFRVTLECDPVTIEKGIIEEYVHRFFQELYPGTDPVHDVVLKRDNALDIVVELPEIQEEERKALFVRVQNELGARLAQKVGYTAPFTLTVVER